MPIRHSKELFFFLFSFVRANVQNLLAQRGGREEGSVWVEEGCYLEERGDSPASDTAGQGRERHTEKAVSTQVS